LLSKTTFAKRASLLVTERRKGYHADDNVPGNDNDATPHGHDDATTF